MTSVEGPTRPQDPTPRTRPVPGATTRTHPTPDDLPHPLGRHQLHDPRSRDYDAADLLPRSALGPTGAPALPTQDRTWPRHCLPWDQGSLRSCTTYAALGLMVSEPCYARAAARAQAGYWKGVTGRVVNGLWQFIPVDCVELYKYETRLDESEIPGIYPPVDTGSTGLWSMKTLQAYKLIDAYHWAFDLNTALSLVATTGPISVGTLWYDSMYYPDSEGIISISPDAQVVGAHQYMIDAVYPTERLVRKVGSWGTQWGLGGSAYLSWDTIERLFAEGGDVVIPTLT